MVPGWEETPSRRSISVPGNAMAAAPVRVGGMTQTLRFSPVLSPNLPFPRIPRCSMFTHRGSPSADPPVRPEQAPGGDPWGNIPPASGAEPVALVPFPTWDQALVLARLAQAAAAPGISRDPGKSTDGARTGSAVGKAAEQPGIQPGIHCSSPWESTGGSAPTPPLTGIRDSLFPGNPPGSALLFPWEFTGI